MKDWKLAIHVRDSYTCQRCGAKEDPHTRSFQVHHLVPRSQGGNNNPENLILACPYCHKHYFDPLAGLKYSFEVTLCSFEKDMTRREKRRERYEKRFLKGRNRIEREDRKEEKRKLLGYKGGI